MDPISKPMCKFCITIQYKLEKFQLPNIHYYNHLAIEYIYNLTYKIQETLKLKVAMH